MNYGMTKTKHDMPDADGWRNNSECHTRLPCLHNSDSIQWISFFPYFRGNHLWAHLLYSLGVSYVCSEADEGILDADGRPNFEEMPY